MGAEYTTMRNLFVRTPTLDMYCQADFLIGSDPVPVLTMRMINHHTTTTRLAWLALCSAYVMGGWDGLVIRGAPSGEGVREAVLLVLFGGQYPWADLLMALVASREVAASGNLLFYLSALTIKTKRLPNV